MPRQDGRRPPRLDGDVDDLAEFFDKTDTEDLEWEDTDVSFARPEMVHISVRIPKADLLTIKKMARKNGLGHTAFVRMLLHKAISGEK